MHLKLFFLAFVLGFAACRPAVKNIIVSPDGSYIEITSDLGTKVDIIKNSYGGFFGLKDFDVVLTGPTFVKDIHLNNQIGGDIIFDLFRRYQGIVDDVIFEKIIYKLEQFVQQGEVHPQVFHMILALHDPTYVELFAQEKYTGSYFNQGYYGNIYNNAYGSNYGQKYENGLYGQDYYGKNYYGKNYYGKNYYGKNYYGQNYYGKNLYGKNYYGQNHYGQNYPTVHSQYYTPSVYSQYYTPSVWDQVLYNKQPYYGVYNYQRYNSVNDVLDNEIVGNKLGYGLPLYGQQGTTGAFWRQLQAGNLYNRYTPVNYYNLYNTQTPSYYNYLYNKIPYTTVY